tara:strand:+ start:1248 stop:1790 length:543 start_codon:yes stop_codon:yes gene_type:complete
MQRQAYNKTAILTHWLLAIFIFFLFISSWWMLALPLPSEEYRYRELPFQLHKNLGITLVLMLAILLYSRWKHRPEELSSQAMTLWMHRFAVIGRVALYFTIFACCVSGYLSSAYSGWVTTLWWVVDLPDWAYESEDLNMLYSDIHLWTCWILLALVAVHLSGAIYHAFLQDGVVRRMIRW